MIRCLAVDDEAYATKIIADYINKIPFLELAGTTTSAIDALSQVQQGNIDLVFLDIQMPDLTGIQFLKLCGNKCKVILTTAYPEYALDGFEHDVIDYLLKPVAFDRFYKAAQKALNIINPTVSQAAPVTENQPIVNPPSDYMFIKGESKNKFLKVDYHDILYIEGLKNYVSVFTTSQRIVTYQTLRDMESTLPQPPFYRVHKSYIISIDKIRMVDGNTVYIQDQSIPIGDTYRDDFFKLIRESE
ncbi:LytR/AlgR family response regulator transcription factor [Mucilaginibacter jinjuensis]|uniref:LytTR family DNA-binding domain-containing protein n=1 Tax=Mucilaginibacter jinjuensis TaxID=1176721 RepID=A0ABY7TEY5_9SPHI|nr:LytTR family DNA-binding domain-containing protein [Mucilaginibacter jinjuensis]WCT14794.1 LytTR family DNA-binding domain-containing protein [Mucilaginibacter jinjuensis]